MLPRRDDIVVLRCVELLHRTRIEVDIEKIRP
jgi:hypothetical protein